MELDFMPNLGSFRKNIAESSESHKSKIVLNLDFVLDSSLLLSKALTFLDRTSKYVCAFKINRHLSLPLGLDKLKIIVQEAHDKGVPIIMDCKINDIGSTNTIIANKYFDVGFDAVIANPFVGWDEGLAPVFQSAKKRRKGVILLIYMSHKGASEGYGQQVIGEDGKIKPQYIVFAEKALKWNADGAIVGATYPEKIEEIRTVLKGKIPIYSPGIGIQGGKITEALSAGADYLLIGRSIIQSESPEDTLKQYLAIIQ